MSEQVWTAKKAQDIQCGDLISSRRGDVALEVISVKIEGEKVLIRHYSNVYKELDAIYEMKRNQTVPVAVSGVNHMDIITNHIITK